MHQWRQIIIFISVLSMALGAFAAIGQNNIKRLMAYSSIGHMGYALLGLAAGTALGVRGVLIYLAIYVFTNLGVFACIQAMRRDGQAVEDIADLAGLARTQPRWRLRFAALFSALRACRRWPASSPNSMSSWPRSRRSCIVPAVLGVLASAMGAFYYLRLVKVMYFDEPVRGLRPRHRAGLERHHVGTQRGRAVLHLVPRR